MREISYEYTDPVDIIWVETAKRLGLRVERSDTVFASWDGQNKMTLSTSSHFDADDSLAQLIFHELCHALTEGSNGQIQVDWGLDNTSEKDLVREHACHRLQAALAQAYGLRRFFGVTTQWRSYYDALPDNPLEDSDDPAAKIAQDSFARFTSHPWQPSIHAALTATSQIARLTSEFCGPQSLWSTFEK